MGLRRDGNRAVGTNQAPEGVKPDRRENGFAPFEVDEVYHADGWVGCRERNWEHGLKYRFSSSNVPELNPMLPAHDP
jgi:hypothetical protein